MKSKVHNTSDDTLFQNVGLLAQSLATLIDNRDIINLCYTLQIFYIPVQWHILTENIPNYPTHQFITSLSFTKCILSCISVQHVLVY